VSKHKRILITGGAGFIGRNLYRNLLAKKHEIIVLDDFSSSPIINSNQQNLKVIDSSILDFEKLLKTADESDCIVHLAARGSVPRSFKNPRSTFESNVIGTFNVCEVGRILRIPIIFASSSSVYGSNTLETKSENDWTSPISPYGSSKLSGESLLVSYSRSFKLRSAAFRLFNVYGPGQRPEHEYSAVIPRWIWSSINSEELKVFGDGSTTRDFTYVDDVVEIIIGTIEKENYFDGITNLAFGNPVSLNSIINIIKTQYPKLIVKHEGERAGDIRYSSNSSNKIRELFPDINETPIQIGILETIKWLEQNKREIKLNPIKVSE
jgi:UDP-glucose 4-epimerase